VLLICSSAEKVTISDIGRKLNITRQGASKVVAGLRDRGYLAVSPSPADAREKVLTLTPRAVQFLLAHYKAASTIETRLRSELGDEAVDQLFRLLEFIAGDNPGDPDEIPPLHAIRWRERYDPL
jgi:DNA-binding MarR family transcriptional regulator